MGSEEKNIFFFSFAAVLHRAAPKSDQRLVQFFPPFVF
jgi:hypothetical protein